MRIGIFSDRYLPQTDGVCFSIETFRMELEKLGHEVYIFAPKPSWRYKERSKRVIRFPAVKGLFFEDQLTSLFFPPQALKQIEKLQLDVIHYQTPGQIGLLGAYYGLRHHIPVITTYHTDLFEYVKHYPQVLPGTIALALLMPVVTGGGMSEYREALSSIKPERSVDSWNQKIVVRVLTMLHNRCNLVITPSRKIERQLKSWKTTARIVTLPTGVDKIATTKREKTLFKKKFNLSDNDKLVTFVGRVGTEKNLGLLIKSFDIIGRKVPEAKLIIAGPGDDLPYFQEQAGQSEFADRIIFTGFMDRSRLGALYELTDVFAFPSLTDTQGMVLNEAACAGAPIVMVDPYISEVVIDGENGYITRNSTRGFAAKIVNILTNTRLREKMSRRSMELGETISAANQAEKLVKLYQETIEDYQSNESTKKVFTFHS
jgi:1,2-diacylglycerol 3-alpha-glucosyltransferase